ncbi:hypothetical Protein YC6258_03475 [Gynuella sunshinyii YC6258]|uniref:Uncharacterized protein n=1 Tax=Gynuella sunshinyii YC6258 TaxID=1445510 RepID=A0A0C5VMG4_9GAMM|nr:hypothetical Protein YC6258_03475 [Gynuella sunshinyii YC6258]
MIAIRWITSSVWVRTVVTSLAGNRPQYLYNNVYCARGEMETFIGNEGSREPER